MRRTLAIVATTLLAGCNLGGLGDTLGNIGNAMQATQGGYQPAMVRPTQQPVVNCSTYAGQTTCTETGQGYTRTYTCSTYAGQTTCQ